MRHFLIHSLKYEINGLNLTLLEISISGSKLIGEYETQNFEKIKQSDLSLHCLHINYMSYICLIVRGKISRNMILYKYIM